MNKTCKCADCLYTVLLDQRDVNRGLFRYLEMLLEYLQDYTDRVKPLLDQNDLYGKVLLDFEKKWDVGTFPGWPVSSLATLFI